jgi:hypothetical protein
MLAARTTLAHFSVSSPMNFPNSAGEVGNTVLPRSANRAFITGLASAALISLLITEQILVKPVGASAHSRQTPPQTLDCWFHFEGR